MLFDNPPSFGQFAINGIWEEAWAFHVDNPPSNDDLLEYLAGGNEVAFELFFGASFFGIRFSGSPTFVYEFAQHCLVCMQSSSDAVSIISEVGSHPLCGELCQKVTHLEVGALNAWKSVGPFRLLKPTITLANIDKLWLKLCATPLSRDIKHAKAVEISYSEPHPHWLGFPISAEQPPHDLSKEMLRKVLHKFIGTNG